MRRDPTKTTEGSQAKNALRPLFHASMAIASVGIFVAGLIQPKLSAPATS
jgi:hypothetical protein